MKYKIKTKRYPAHYKFKDIKADLLKCDPEFRVLVNKLKKENYNERTK